VTAPRAGLVQIAVKSAAPVSMELSAMAREPVIMPLGVAHARIDTLALTAHGGTALALRVSLTKLHRQTAPCGTVIFMSAMEAQSFFGEYVTMTLENATARTNSMAHTASLSGVLNTMARNATEKGLVTCSPRLMVKAKILYNGTREETLLLEHQTRWDPAATRARLKPCSQLRPKSHMRRKNFQASRAMASANATRFMKESHVNTRNAPYSKHTPAAGRQEVCVTRRLGPAFATLGTGAWTVPMAPE